jgi:hypothetical protein
MLFGFGVCCLAIPAGVALVFLMEVLFRRPDIFLPAITIVGTAAIVASRLIGRKVEP